MFHTAQKILNPRKTKDPEPKSLLKVETVGESFHRRYNILSTAAFCESLVNLGACLIMAYL